MMMHKIRDLLKSFNADSGAGADTSLVEGGFQRDELNICNGILIDGHQ
jgi:hypothetical protein